MARITAQGKEAFFLTAALQVGFELLLDVIRQRPAGFRSQRTKRGIVLLHQLIQQRGFRAMAGVARRIEKWRRALSPRSGGGGHDKRPCIDRGRKRLWQDDAW